MKSAVVRVFLANGIFHPRLVLLLQSSFLLIYCDYSDLALVFPKQYTRVLEFDRALDVLHEVVATG
jgi:hypothetical protein